MIEALKKVYDADALVERAARRHVPRQRRGRARWNRYHAPSSSSADESLHRRGDRSDLSAAAGVRDPCARRQSRGARRHRGRRRRDQQSPEAAGRALVGSHGPAQAVRARRLRDCRARAAAHRARHLLAARVRRARVATAWARACAARRATRCWARWRRMVSAGRVFGFHRAMDHLGAVIGPLVATAFLWFYPGRVPNALCAHHHSRRCSPSAWCCWCRKRAVREDRCAWSRRREPDRPDRPPTRPVPTPSRAQTFSRDPDHLHARQFSRRIPACSACRTRASPPPCCRSRGPGCTW